MNQLRWQLFKLLSHVAWRICPEPQRSDVWAAWHDAKEGSDGLV